MFPTCFLTTCSPRVPQIWQVYNDRHLVRTYQGHREAVRDVNFNNDGTQFLSASHDRYCKLWDTETGGALRRGVVRVDLCVCVCVCVCDMCVSGYVWLSAWQGVSSVCGGVCLYAFVCAYVHLLMCVCVRVCVVRGEDRVWSGWIQDLVRGADPTRHLICVWVSVCFCICVCL